MGECHSTCDQAPALQNIRVPRLNLSTMQDTSIDREVDVPLDSLGIRTPDVPGDVSLCGELSSQVTALVARRYKSWIYLNTGECPQLRRQELSAAGVKLVARPFPGPPVLPTTDQVNALMDSLDLLPRPLMVQCSSGLRASVALVLWLGKRRGYNAGAADQLIADLCMQWCRTGPMRQWLLRQFPSDLCCAPRGLYDDQQLIFQQLYDAQTSSFTYLLGCSQTQECILIDPVLDQFDRDMSLIQELGLELKYTVETHMHADHVTSSGLFKKAVAGCMSVVPVNTKAVADIQLQDGDRLKAGNYELKAMDTPGHTSGCMTYTLQARHQLFAFTGDALLIRGCGRTDFQGGDPGKLFDSIHSKIFTLPDDTCVYPAHDYKGRNTSTVEEEKCFNARLARGRAEFVSSMKRLKLPYPTSLEECVRLNMNEGRERECEYFHQV